MSSKLLISLIAGAVVVAGIFYYSQSNKNDNLSSSENVENSKKVTPSVMTPSVTETKVVKMTEQDAVRLFFSLIDEGKATDAVGMMTPTALGDDSMKQAWGVQFNDIEAIKVMTLEPSLNQSYKVVLDVRMKVGAANAPIPNYGWENGTNIRWIPVEKINGVWKIGGIATGP